MVSPNRGRDGTMELDCRFVADEDLSDAFEEIDCDMQAGGGTRSVLGRVAAIIDAFDEANQLLTLNDLTHRTDLPKSTVHRLAEQLRGLGWLEREGIGYRVGMRLFEVGGLATRRSKLCDKAFPHLHALATKTGLAVQLAILDGDEVIYLERIPGSGFTLPTRAGGRMPAYCTGLGKAMLAFDDAAVDLVIQRGFTRRTPHTIVTPDALHDEMHQIRLSGLAIDRQEAYMGLACVAAPIRNSGRAVAAVSVTGPASVVNFDVLAADVRTVAAAIWKDRFPSMYRQY